MEMEKTMGVPKPEGSGTEQYLEEMQRIFAAREETYQKRKQEYEQKSQELQKIQTELVLWSSIFVTLMANKIGGLQFGIYRNCQISSRVSHTAVAALPLTKANRSDFE